MQGCPQSFLILERRNKTISVKSSCNETQRINSVLSNMCSPHSSLLWYPSSHYKVGCDHCPSLCLTLLKGALIKESPGFLARWGRLKKPANKNPREDVVILIYNRKYVLLWDVLQLRLWVIRKFFLKRNLDLSHSSASHFTEIPLIVCGSSQKDGNSLQTLNSCPNSQEKHIDLLYIEGKDAVLYKN